MSDHVVFGEKLEAYQDPARGRCGRAASSPPARTGLWLDPVTTIADLAA